MGYGFTEGWAHYSEEMIWEAGFGDGDPRLHIGQLQNALLRNVRYIVALGLHTGSLTLAEAERMFADQGGVRKVRSYLRFVRDPSLRIF